jgi:hypothetical protein
MGGAPDEVAFEPPPSLFTRLLLGEPHDVRVSFGLSIPLAVVLPSESDMINAGKKRIRKGIEYGSYKGEGKAPKTLS